MPTDVDTTATSDATATGSTRTSDAADSVEKNNSARANDPKVREKLERLRQAAGADLKSTSGTLDKGGAAARSLEAGDASGASRLRATAPLASMPTAGTMAPPVSTPMPSMGPTAMAAPAMQAVSTGLGAAASMAAPQQSAPMSSASPGPGQVALTPAQQQALRAALADGGADSGGSATGVDKKALAMPAGGGKLNALVKNVLGIDYAWGAGTLDGPSKGTSDGGGAADAHGDTSKTGFDCSGLTRYLYAQDTGMEIPRTSEAQYEASQPVSTPEPGDLVFPSSAGVPPGHVQMYIGNGQVVHAPQSGDVVRIAPLEPGASVRRPVAA